jgi:cytochrome P450
VIYVNRVQGIPHASTEDDVYGDLKIPKGTILFPNLVTLKRDQDRYLDPDAFEPKRFLGDTLDASASALQADYQERDHVHYGFGRRLCQGIFVAEASLFIAISRILWAFRFQELPECPIKMSDKICKETPAVNNS